MTRFLLYSHDTYGLGHFRRTTAIATGLVAADPTNEALIVTGSPRTHAFPLPDRIDTVKLPAATKDVDGSYRPRKLGSGLERLIDLRSTIVCSTAAAYEPDVVVVDHAPLGMAGELGRLLRSVDRLATRPRMVLGLRDIIDASDRVDQAWQRSGIWDALDRYDDIVVYGDPIMTTTALELDLDRRTTATVTHTGYVAPAMPEPETDEPFLLVTPGGGGDGQALVRRFLDAVEAGATTGVRSIVVTGPLLSASRRTELEARAALLPSVELLEFTDTMRSLIASAVGVISMAGYNTVVEELMAGTPALLVPRCAPRLEQHLRARRLQRVAPVCHTSIERLSPRSVRGFLDHCLRHPPRRTIVDLTGIATVAGMLASRMRPERTPAHV